MVSYFFAFSVKQLNLICLVGLFSIAAVFDFHSFLKIILNLEQQEICYVLDAAVFIVDCPRIQNGRKR